MSWINGKNPKVELINLFLDSDQPMDAALAWARNVAQRAGLDVKKNQVRLLREIRQADPSMDLKVATYLAREVAQGSK
ncbi:hypothetical protein ACN083_03910 [Rothia sp. CCM 9418]|uniref:hypothetical protein n=1 Tax=Rothia sp. CCM 9418 TaxID=3402661 RepID=UPI003AEE7495